MLNTVIYSLIAGSATVAGTLIIFYREQFARKNSVYIISFAAGVMLATSFLHLIPEASEAVTNVTYYVLFGFLLFYLVQNFLITLHPCSDEKCEVHHLGLMSFIGLTLHSFLDGIAIAVGFEVSEKIGVFTALAVILHELPEGLVTTGILMHTNTKRKFIWIYSLIVAFATPLGAILSLFFLEGMSENMLAILLAITAGSFIYLAAADLIPEIHKSNRKLNSLILIFGILVIYFLTKYLD